MDYRKLHPFGKNLALLLAAILCMPRSAASQYENTYYVTPNVSTCNKVNYTCQDFKTYFNNASYYFQSGTEFIFLPGVHLFDLGSFLSVQDIVNIRLVGSDNFTQRSVAADVEEYGFDPYAYDKNISYFQSSTIILCTNPSGLSFSNVTNLTLSNLTIINCGQNIAAFNISTGIYLSNVYDLLVDGLSVWNSSGFGLFGINVLGQSQIMRSSFVGSNQYVKNNLQQVPIKNCMNEVGRLYVPDNSGFGGNIIFQYSNVPTTSLKCQINIFYVLVALGINDGPYGAGLTLISNEENKNLTVNIDNLVTYRNNGYNGTNFYIFSSSNASVVLTNIFSAYATSVSSGGIYDYKRPVYKSLFTIKHSIFECNFSEEGTGSSLYIYCLMAFQYALIENCTFSQDQAKYSLYVKGNNNENQNTGQVISSSLYGSSISIDGLEYKINNVVAKNSTWLFTNSVIDIDLHHTIVQSKIISSYSNIHFHGNNTFIQSNIIARYSNVYLEGNNTFCNSILPSSGGVISLLETSTLTFSANSTTIFSNNTAIYGGAIYIDSDSRLYIGSPTNISFINNTAVFTGGAIYVEALTTTTCFYSLNCMEIESIHLYFDSNYAGDAGSVLYGGNIDTCQIQPTCIYNSTYVFNKITLVGYHNPSSSLISSDSPCLYICNESANFECLTDQNVTLYPGQIFTLSLITVGQRYSIVPTVILVYSITGNRVIGIMKTLKKCNSYGIPYEPNNGTLKLIPNTALNSGQFLINSYSLDIIVSPCPLLFTNSSSSCICDPLLQRYNLVCNISDVTVLNTGNIWIGLTSQNSTAYQQLCPFDYCTGNKTINVLDLDSQCSYNRSGVLCGGCQGNLSMTFGTSQCESCSNYFLLLIFVFIGMGLFLVLVVFISKITVTNGALNGIVLYANLIRINDNIFFQNTRGYSSFLSVLIAWINLDWGINTCFYNGMDSYAKTWLQFVFPISLIGMVILAARYSTSLSKLFRFNAVPVLSTLVLLSYSNILQIIITIFSPVSLNTMNNAADSYVWQYDGNVEYLGKKHLPLFIFGLLVIIFIITPYLCILLLAPCLQSRSHWRYLQWVNKLKPFLDSYQAPFKDRYRFWPGVLLFIRLPLYLVFIMSDSTSVKMLAIIACVLIYMCMAVGLSVYKKWSDLLIEMAFIINISIISSSFLAIGDSGSCGIILFFGVTGALMLTGYIIVYERMTSICNKVPVNGIRRQMVNIFAGDAN